MQMSKLTQNIATAFHILLDFKLKSEVWEFLCYGYELIYFFLKKSLRCNGMQSKKKTLLDSMFTWDPDVESSGFLWYHGNVRLYIGPLCSEEMATDGF